ncbi:MULTISPECIES: NAD(P)/FAD-dependent oxidoreductase [unclassified Streptomyces]|uniref:NAD(P)/FAD-dependent oxidoreductase n=1 Tax=unclassified Streptomyces TaxID=2593676 RepID=UPI00278C63C7|nr:MULTISPECIES: FAD-dependent oxidoreductase [unclassified Streptomyces]
MTGVLRDIVIVGGSLAAATAAGALRTAGFDGGITLVSDEHRPPYTRPPLSKDILKGRAEPESAALPLAEGVDLRLGARATGLRPDRRRVLLSDGDQLPYDGLIVATGARARSLAVADGAPELRLRSMDDALALRSAVRDARTVAVIGGGPLGMEVASACRELGREVTVVDPEPPMRRQLGGYLADLLTHAAHDAGVRFVRPGGPVAVASDGAGGAVVVGQDVRVAADVVVTAAGDLPNTEWLAGSGLPLDRGLLVDGTLTVAPGIVAAGDVVAWRDGGASARTPLWTHALDQATAAASALLNPGTAAKYRARPYFWTEQFGLAVKVCGTIPADARPTVLDGSYADRRLLLQWEAHETPVAAATVNHRMPITRLRRLATAAPQTPATHATSGPTTHAISGPTTHAATHATSHATSHP